MREDFDPWAGKRATAQYYSLLLLSRRLAEFIEFVNAHYRWQVRKQVMEELALGDPVSTYFALIDWITPNEEKQWRVLSYIANSESLILPIIGDRGSGKTVTAYWIAENVYNITGGERPIVMVGRVDPNLVPDYVTATCKNLEDAGNRYPGSLIILDEAGRGLGSRDSMSQRNKAASKLLFISRHKDLSVLFITQNSATMDVNIMRMASALIVKKMALFQDDTERDFIRALMGRTHFSMHPGHRAPRKGEPKVDVHKETLFIGPFTTLFWHDPPASWRPEHSKAFMYLTDEDEVDPEVEKQKEKLLSEATRKEILAEAGIA